MERGGEAWGREKMKENSWRWRALLLNPRVMGGRLTGLTPSSFARTAESRAQSMSAWEATRGLRDNEGRVPSGAGWGWAGEAVAVAVAVGALSGMEATSGAEGAAGLGAEEVPEDAKGWPGSVEGAVAVAAA